MIHKKPKNKRMKISKRYSIEKKVKEHNRKQRKESKKNPKPKKSRKDPGIPNSWPYKEELLQEIEQAREQAKLEKIKAREARLEAGRKLLEERKAKEQEVAGQADEMDEEEEEQEDSDEEESS